jgi:tight adherence protein D
VFLKARVAYLNNKLVLAHQYAQTALSLSSSYPEAENLMGLIQAERGELSSAREHFISARRHYYDDAIIKNNLAVIDLIEEDYQSAVQRLQPLYLKAGGDKQITSNLLIAYAKLGEYQAVREILKEQDYKEEQIRRIFLVLRGMGKVSQEEDKVKKDLPPQEQNPITGIQVKVDRGPGYEAH